VASSGGHEGGRLAPAGGVAGGGLDGCGSLWPAALRILGSSEHSPIT
jgi:hypothetical protein